VVDPRVARELFVPLVEELRKVFTVTPDALMDAIVRGGVGQALDLTTGVKIDLYMREGVPGELSRSVERELAPGFQVRVVSLEDALLSKLMWIRKGSHRSRRDVQWLLDVLTEEQRRNVERSAAELGLLTLLNEVRTDVEPSE
jgi:hypothetical protein